MGGYHVLQQRVTPSGSAPVLLRLGASETWADQILERITRAMVLVGIAIAFFYPLAGYVLAGRATKPLAGIVKKTAELKPINLHERLPLRGTRDELDQLAQTINGFLDRIAGFLQQNREFTANVAHELRSPLTAFQVTLELALNADRSSEEYKELLLELLEKCSAMASMVNKLLLLAESDAELLCTRHEPVRLDQVVLKSLELFQILAESAQVEIKVGKLAPVVLQGDGQRLWQVVNNLLDNAIKFTPAGGVITLELQLHEKTQEGTLTVADTGIGVTPEDLPHLFERFYQGKKSHGPKKPGGGIGLGLSICQAIVSAHHGTITVASTPGKGTTFTITLPGCSPIPLQP